MWNLDANAEYLKRAARWPTKYRREFNAIHSNLDTLLIALNGGAKLEQIHFGFMHSEPQGIIAIDQKGGGSGLKETRLYIYPMKASQIIHVITLGDKSTQKTDIKYAREFVVSLAKHQEN